MKTETLKITKNTCLSCEIWKPDEEVERFLGLINHTKFEITF